MKTLCQKSKSEKEPIWSKKYCTPIFISGTICLFADSRPLFEKQLPPYRIDRPITIKMRLADKQRTIRDSTELQVEATLDVDGDFLGLYILALFFKHCQRHNGPEDWVHLTKETSWGHITNSNTNLGQISSSESQPSINFKISTKHQHLD